MELSCKSAGNTRLMIPRIENVYWIVKIEIRYMVFLAKRLYQELIFLVMDGSLPTSLKYIISNVEYYGPALYLLGKKIYIIVWSQLVS